MARHSRGAITDTCRVCTRSIIVRGATRRNQEERGADQERHKGTLLEPDEEEPAGAREEHVKGPTEGANKTAGRIKGATREPRLLHQERIKRATREPRLLHQERIKGATSEPRLLHQERIKSATKAEGGIRGGKPGGGTSATKGAALVACVLVGSVLERAQADPAEMVVALQPRTPPTHARRRILSGWRARSFLRKRE